MAIKEIYLARKQNIKNQELLCCPFCGAPGQIIEDEDDIIKAICPSGVGVTCAGDCWIGGTIIDYNAWQKRSFLNQIKKALNEAISIINDLIDEDPCSYDHHGYCQAHGWLYSDRPCPQARAKKFIEKYQKV